VHTQHSASQRHAVDAGLARLAVGLGGGGGLDDRASIGSQCEQIGSAQSNSQGGHTQRTYWQLWGRGCIVLCGSEAGRARGSQNATPADRYSYMPGVRHGGRMD
jgi:hypothetical protein